MVRIMGMVVVFCTTYALILPAITMEKETICEKQAHLHEESCYAQVSVWNCGLETGMTAIHSHGELCVDAQGTLICQLPECVEHSHEEGCYQQAQEPVCGYVHEHSAACATVQRILSCGLEESSGHTHSDACGSTQKTLICTEPVTAADTVDSSQPAAHIHEDGCYQFTDIVCTLDTVPAHSHGDTCYSEREVFCDQPTTEEHVHSEDCYEKQLSCGLEECVVHIHAETCYDADQNLICQQPQVVVHEHNQTCLDTLEQEQLQLTCQLEEHTHEDACYPAEEEAFEFFCGFGVHDHVETCYDELGELVCSIPVHAHEAACVLKDLDLTADVETELDWQLLFQNTAITGNWPTDVLTVARSQLNYRESEKNMILVGEELKGYTRYGAWYGDPYGQWDVMFASFCLNYAGVQDIPWGANANDWMEAMKELQLYAEPETYTPKPGDLIFFDYDQVEEPLEEIPVIADQVGIVAEVISAAGEESGTVSFIIGNYDEQVSYVTCDQKDVTIVGYTDMPAGDIFYMTHEGADFTVTITVGSEAGIPDSAQLAVREIEEGSDEYNTYYQQSIEALMNSSATGEEAPEVSFARFFDISFLVDGVAVEPAAPVDIQIRYQDMLEKKEEEDGLVVHFAKEGVEVLNADTYSAEPVQEEDSNVLDKIAELFTGESEKVDTFRFTQNSFSVSGTLFAATPRAVTAAQRINLSEMDDTGGTEYIIYTQVGNQYYALSAPQSGSAAKLVQISVSNNGTVTWNTNEDIFWTFARTSTNIYDAINANGRYLHVWHNSNNDYGSLSDKYNGVRLVPNNGVSFGMRHPSNEGYAYVSGGYVQGTNRSNNLQQFYLAAVPARVYHVWFDGTNGGMMSYYGSDDTYQAVDPADNTIKLPETWKSPTKYGYSLAGWYNIKTNTYHKPGEEVTIEQHSVFYADWIAATYDVGQQNADTVTSVDTSNFITTYVFDYNVLFNLLSQSHTGTVSATKHSETWTVLNNGEAVPYNGEKSLGFSFIDYDAGGDISYANSRDEINYSRSQTTTGIISHVQQVSGKNLLDLLFNPGTSVIGKKYVGTGNYLFQYMDSTTSNYDGEHDGYYYLDARLNAASYNQSAQRFYLYNYLERTSDSEKDKGGGEYSDFLPFNSPYLFDENQLNSYMDSEDRSGWTYDAKAGNDSYNSTDDAATNYFFGTRTDIEFFLPNNAGWHDEYGNYGNISTRGQHMVFEFHGDDDVWVFVDGQLILDIGGMHGIQHGQIDFSTGKVTYGANGEVDGGTLTMAEGTHTMTVYYMERGSSQSNCAIYFNIAPRYDLEITKEDVVTATKLDRAVFSIFNDEAMTSPAQLWESEEAYNADMADDGLPNSSTNTFTVKNGIAKCWGISAGKTYYIYETTPPPEYPESDDMIRITLNNRGTATIETTTLHGSNHIATEGFAVIKQEINETLKIVALTVTNQKDGDHTEVRVEKNWAAGSDLPQNISVFLTRDGERFGRTAVLNEGNGWAYTWTGLEKYRSEGIEDPYIYEVQEVQVPGFITIQGESREVVDYVDWIRSAEMSDSKTYLLVHDNQALTCDGSFGWMSVTQAEQESSLSAQWKVTTDHDGFHLKNGLGYTLTYGDNSFYGTQSDANELNQVFYYLNSRLVVHDHDVYYQFGSNGSVVQSDGLAFTLYQKEVLTGLLTQIVNEPVNEEEQTFVEVNKTWSDGAAAHEGDSVVIHLFADGQDTGLTLTLNKSNNWTGRFEDLPYYQSNGSTVIKYTVEEADFTDYLPEYSDPEELEGIPVSYWKGVTELRAGTFRFSYGGYSLGINTSGEVVPMLSDSGDTYQQWRLTASGSGYRLQNVGAETYLRISSGNLATTTRGTSAAVVTMTGNRITLDSRYYLELGASHAGVSTNSANATLLLVNQWAEAVGKPGTGYTVNNIGAVYQLPNTGGPELIFFTFGGMLMLSAAALMYNSKIQRKRQKGGKYQR